MTRIGASQAFFNIVAQFNAEKLIRDSRSLNTVMKAVSLDTFEAILKPIDDMIMQLDNALGAVREFGEGLGDATVEFEKFYGEANNLEAVRDDLIDVGEAYAFVGTEALAAGSRAAQVANLIGRQNVDLLVEQAAILAEISDLTLEEAQRGIIQLNQQAGILYGEMTRQQIMSLSAREQEIILTENAARSLDVLNTVANRSVALEGDLVKTMTNFASGAKLAGDSFEFMAAASATLLEAGEEQGTAGRALRMMYARLGGDINGARSKIEEMGFSLTQSNGQMKSMQGVLEDLHTNGWGELNPAVKQNIAQTIAGNRHYVRFIKLMENYERVVNLSADASLRLDSASEQAEKALQSEVRQLQKMEAQVENAKAAIGEGLLPVLTGSAEAQRDFLNATEMLTDGLGGFGKAIGRGMGVFKITEGFLKFGIALQSIGIGLDMFSSVQRSLQGVEVAMANLHSKQATYLGYGVTATEEQSDLMQGLLYHQQVINRANKESQLSKSLILGTEKERAAIADRITAKEEMGLRIMEKQLAYDHERRALLLQEKSLEAGDGGMYSKRAARIDYENMMGRELLATQKEIYTQKMGSEDAYMRQMLADFDVFGNFNEDERTALENKNQMLREQHTILQQIKAENEASRALRGAGEDGESGRTTKFLESFGEKEITQMRELMSVRKDELNGYQTKLESYKQMNESQQVQYSNNKKMIAGIDNLNKAFMDNSGVVDLSKQGYDSLMVLLQETAGEFYQTERAIRTIEAAEKDAAKMTNRLTEVRRLSKALTKDQLHNSKNIMNLEIKDAKLKEKILPLLNNINSANITKEKQEQSMIEIIQMLTTEEEQLTNALKRRKAEMAQSYKTSEKFKHSQQRAASAQRSLNIGMSNFAGMAGGMFLKGATGAAASMGMMGTQMLYAGGATAKAGVELYKVQKEIYATQLALSPLGSKLPKATAGFLAFGKAIAPLVIVGGALYLFAKQAEASAKYLKDLDESVQGIDSTFDRFTKTTKIFGDNDALAERLGMTNYTMEELKGNTELTEKALTTLNNSDLRLNEQLTEAVNGAKDLLNVLSAIQNDKIFKDEFLAEKALGKLMDETGGFGGFMQYYSLGKEDTKQMRQFYEELGLEFQQSSPNLFKSFIQDVDAIFRSGYKFSEKELEQMSQFIDEDDIMTQIRAINSLVISAAEADIYMANLDKSAKDTSNGMADAATEIENLTQELYDFSGAREELFFGGKFGNVTGSLYKQVVTQGVGTLYHKNEVIMSNNFHGFFNEREAADRIVAILNQHIDGLTGGVGQ